jgi:hypothetical protein
MAHARPERLGVEVLRASAAQMDRVGSPGTGGLEGMVHSLGAKSIASLNDRTSTLRGPRSTGTCPLDCSGNTHLEDREGYEAHWAQGRPSIARASRRGIYFATLTVPPGATTDQPVATLDGLMA